ncbi:MAG TPA: OpgC domain-containing protein [Kofleriaceae bacterium]|nr:OpgC domain-containing protein [Kofleriaceae bacterium]
MSVASPLGGGLAVARRARDPALDLLRGYFLIVIMIDHLRFAKNPLYLISGDQSLWVTAAEGFVLMSGFLVGVLRGDEARGAGLAAAARHLWRRAGVLAAWCIALTIGFRTISQLTGYWPAVPNADTHGGFLADVLGALVLRRTYGDHNLLAAYALFLAAAPLVLAALLRGWTVAVLGASIALWAAAYDARWAWSNTVQADLCWQVLFMIGIVAGFHRDRLAAWWRARAPGARRAYLGALAAASVAIVVGSLLRMPVGAAYPTALETRLFDRERLGPGRAAAALVLVTGLYALVRRFEAPLVRTVGRVLVPLGQASLYVYIVQSMITFVLVDRTQANPAVAAAITGAVIATVTVMVRRRWLFAIIPR